MRPFCLEDLRPGPGELMTMAADPEANKDTVDMMLGRHSWQLECFKRWQRPGLN